MPPRNLNSGGPRGLAFYDFDGTLVSGNVVDQYLWYARRDRNWWRQLRLAFRGPRLKLTDLRSREAFNHLFYREYGGFLESWLRSEATKLYAEYVRPHLYGGVEELLASNVKEGFVNVLVTGSLDFAMAPVVEMLGFEELLSNRLEFVNGQATGRLLPPVLAGTEKVRAMLDLCRRYNVEPVNCRAYSDDLSDLPMLTAVGQGFATNPKASLGRVASKHNLQTLELGRRA